MSITISEAARVSLISSGGLRTLEEIHDYIQKNQLYVFKEGADSLHILRTQIDRRCANSNVTGKSNSLIFFVQNDRYGLLEKLSDLEVLQFLTEEQYIEWIKNKKNREDKSFESLSKKIDSLETTLEDFPDLVDEAQSAKTAFEDARQSYEEKLNFHVSKQYWEDKRGEHETNVRKFSRYFGWVLLLTITIVFALWITYDPISESFVNGKKQFIIHYFLVSLIVLVSSIGLWICRLLVKVVLSNLHLQEEAREKETMLVTYLALIKDGGIEVDDRKVVLDAVFRPSSNGIIQADSSVTVLDIINAFKKK